MPLVRIMFKQVQSLRVGESVMFNEAHIAVSQANENRPMWFDRIPQVGESVVFSAPQGRGVVSFQVEQVQHFPCELDASLFVPAVPQSIILLQPILTATN